jgi:hypothetical protein
LDVLVNDAAYQMAYDSFLEILPEHRPRLAVERVGVFVHERYPTKIAGVISLSKAREPAASRPQADAHRGRLSCHARHSRAAASQVVAFTR